MTRQTGSAESTTNSRQPRGGVGLSLVPHVHMRQMVAKRFGKSHCPVAGCRRVRPSIGLLELPPSGRYILIPHS